MFLLVPAHPGFPGQIPQSRKTVVCVCVVKIWNSLPATTEDFASLGMFKGLINRVDLSQYVNF